MVPIYASVSRARVLILTMHNTTEKRKKYYAYYVYQVTSERNIEGRKLPRREHVILIEKLTSKHCTQHVIQTLH